MAGPIRISVLANASQARRELNSTGNTATSMGSKFSSAAKTVGKFAAAGLAVAGAAAVKFGIDAVKAASDAQQSLGATETVFGRFADKVVKDSDRAATKFGLSANDYRESANLIGSLFKNQGVATDKLAGKTSDMIGIGADLAATFGGTTADAVESLGSAFKGEFDSLEKYGVSLKESTVKTEAMRIANVKTTSAFDDLSVAQQTQAKQQATTNLILDQAADSAGAFSRESDTLAHRQQVLGAKFENVKTKIGTALLPVLTDLVGWVSDHVVPALDDFGDWLTDHQGDISSAGSTIAHTLLPVLKDLGDIASDVAGFIKELPDPIKSIGVQAGIAALAFPKLSGALSGSVGSITGFASNIRSAETRTAALTGSVRNLAGVGGMIALTSGLSGAADEGASFGDVLKGAAGGAGIGAMFGPIGALIGAGVGGGLTALTGAFSDTSDEARQARLQLIKTEGFQSAKDGADKLRTALQGVINAYGNVGRASVEASFTGEEGKLSDDIALLRSVGVSMDTITSAAMGNAGAMKIVNNAFAESGSKAEANRTKYRNMWDAAQDGMIEWTDYYGNVHVKKLSGEEITELGDKYKYWDDQVKRAKTDAQVFGNRIEKNTGIIASHGHQMRQLAKDLGIPLEQYKKFPKSVRTEIETNGLPETTDGAIRLIKQYKGLQNFKAIKAVISAPGVDLTRGQVENLHKRYNLTPKQIKTLFKLEGVPEATNTLTSGISNMQGKAFSGGSGVGAQLSAGVASGIANNAWQAVNAAAAMVADAVAAARSRKGADAHSPSRKTQKLGKDMGDGLALGMRQSGHQVHTSAKQLVDRILGAARDGLKALNKLRHGFGSDEVARRLVNNAEAQERVNNALVKAKQHYKDLVKVRDDYAKSIKDAIVETGNVTQLNAEDGTTTAGGIIDRLQSRLVAAQRFAELIRKLTNQGLNKTSLQQMLAAGVEGGLATAEAIAAGGSGAIKQINDLTSQLADQGKALGEDTAETFYGAGIKAADGIVDGLTSRAHNLDKAANKLAKKLVHAVRRALKIKSPSRVFRDLGKLTAQGLTIGLDDVHVSQAGDRMAKDLITGFGTPALDAFARVGGTSSNQTSVQIRLTADQISSLQRGREIQADLDMFRSAGGRVGA